MSLFTALLITHVLGGSISLLLGLYVLCVKKGTAVHKKTGKKSRQTLDTQVIWPA